MEKRAKCPRVSKSPRCYHTWVFPQREWLLSVIWKSFRDPCGARPPCDPETGMRLCIWWAGGRGLAAQTSQLAEKSACCHPVHGNCSRRSWQTGEFAISRELQEKADPSGQPRPSG